MRKFITLAVFITAFSCNLLSQVKIGSINPPHEDAVLELKSATKGLLLPRLMLVSTSSAAPLGAHVAGMTVYNTATSSSGDTYVSPGFYYNDGFKWDRLHLGYTNWFYMPTIAFNTTSSALGQTKDLYQAYYEQFSGASNFVKSTGAPNKVPYIPAATDLYYYITDYDTNVFSNISIDQNGMMTYDVVASATDLSYINIVFVLK